MQFWLKTSICQSGMVDECCWVNFPTRVGNLKALTVCYRESTRLVTIVWQPRSGKLRSVHSSGGPCVQSGGQAKNAQISSRDFASNFHSPFKCAQANSLRSPAQKLQMTSCSAVVSSQSRLPFHALINNLIIGNKSCYCSFLNHELSNK